MRLPIDPDGYSVNPSTGTVHTRYAGDHARDSWRTRTARGVENILDGQKGSVCKTCYPSPSYAKPARDEPPQKRRTPTADPGTS